MRYDSLPVHKQSLGRFPAHYTHYTIETTDPGAIRDVICDTVLSRHYSYHHIRHRIIITVSRGWWPRVMSLSPSLTQSRALLIRVIIIVVSVQIFAQDPITGIDFKVSHRNYRLISDLQVKWNCLYGVAKFQSMIAEYLALLMLTLIIDHHL